MSQVEAGAEAVEGFQADAVHFGSEAEIADEQVAEAQPVEDIFAAHLFAGLALVEIVEVEAEVGAACIATGGVEAAYCESPPYVSVTADAVAAYSVATEPEAPVVDLIVIVVKAARLVVLEIAVATEPEGRGAAIVASEFEGIAAEIAISEKDVADTVASAIAVGHLSEETVVEIAVSVIAGGVAEVEEIVVYADVVTAADVAVELPENVAVSGIDGVERLACVAIAT